MALENADTGGGRNPAGRRNDDFADFPRDGHGRPKIIRAVFCEETGQWLVPKDADGKPIKELVPFTRSSTLGGAIEYQGGLHRWKSAVVAWGIARSRTLAKRARAVATFSRREDKDELYEIVDKAQAFAESDQAANHGTALHSVFRRIAEGETLEHLVGSGAIDEEDVPACEAFADAITRFVVVFAERRVVCDEAQTAGKYDIIVSPRRPMPVTDKAGKVVAVIMPGDMICVDNKTSSSADYFGEKFTVQLWTYANGRDYDQETGERTEVGVRKDWALILHIPSNAPEGTVATWHWVDLSIGEHLVKVARSVLEGRKLGKAAITVADLDAEIPEEFLVSAQGNERAELAGPTAQAYAKELAGREVVPGTVIGPKAVCRCVPLTCDECLHIPGCVDAEDPVAWCEHDAEDAERGHLCPPERPCRQRAHFPARCPGSGKTYAPPAADAEAADPELVAAEAEPPSLARSLQDAAARTAEQSSRERARAYLVRKLTPGPDGRYKLRSRAELVDLWRRARKAGYWDKPDAELDPLFAQAGAAYPAVA
jgi:hypothetical protein